MKRKSEILRLVEISRLYYEDGLTQAEIARELDISRPAVSKHLAEARILGIVKIEIKSPFESNDDLQQRLCEKYGLKGGLVVQTGSSEQDIRRRVFFSQAARYVENWVDEVNSIGVSWGEDTGMILDEMETVASDTDRKGDICPLIGSAPYDIKWFQTNELARALSRKTGYAPHYFMAPAFPTSVENKKLFEQTNEFQAIRKLWTRLQMVLIGIGTYPSTPDQATAARFGQKLRKKRAVGMMATYYFDREGQFIESDTDIVMRIPLEMLRKVPNILAFGYGDEKAAAVTGALRTGMITHLITDEGMAHRLLDDA